MVAHNQNLLTFLREGTEKPPILLPLRSSSTFILSTICIAVFTDIFLYSVIVPVIPFSLTARAGVPSEDGKSYTQPLSVFIIYFNPLLHALAHKQSDLPSLPVQHWVSVLLAAYGAALLAASPICGFLADKTPNRRLPLLIGLLALAGATLLLCLGTSLALLILGRVLQGISAAMVWTVGLALLADTVGHEKIGQAVGYVSISMSVALLLGPLLGGLVYAKAGYFSVYFLAFGMIILDILLRIFLIEKKVAKKWAAAGEEEHQGQDPPLTAPPTITPTEPAAPLSTPAASKTRAAPAPAILSPASSSPPQPPPPSTVPQPPQRPLSAVLHLLTSHRLLAALFLTLSQSILMTSWDAVLPLYTSHTFSFTPVGAGLIFLPFILPSFLAPLVGYWADQRGPRVPAVVGFALAAPGLVLLRFVDHGGVGQVVLLCALLVVVGTGATNAMVPLLVEVTGVVVLQEGMQPGVFGGKGAYATAYGLFNTAFAGGMLVGPLWAGFVVNSAGWATMCWSLAVLSVGAAVVSGLFVGAAAICTDDNVEDEARGKGDAGVSGVEYVTRIGGES